MITAKQKNIFFLTCITAFLTHNVYAMVYDNRFIPLYKSPRIYAAAKPSLFSIDAFAATATRAFNDKESSIEIPELYGKFDLNQLAMSMEKAGFANPLRTDLQGVPLPYIVHGKLQAQAFAINLEHAFTDWFSVGTSVLFMKTDNWQQFIFDKKESTLIAGPGDLLEIDQSRRDAFKTIGLESNHATQRGIGDIDIYAHLWHGWNYTLKCRHVFAGFNAGLLIPSGVKRNVDAPSSIPFGGNGHWGFFAQIDGLFEVKEDIKIGGFMGIRKRFTKTQNRRIPLGKEPSVFAPITGALQVDPGITFIVSPYLVLENLREGFGLTGQYTLIIHEEDEWKDARSEKNPSSRLIDAIERTEWATDYITISAFYDFGANRVCHSFNPLVSIKWDFPVMFFVSKRAAKTNRIAIGIEFDY